MGGEGRGEKSSFTFEKVQKEVQLASISHEQLISAVSYSQKQRYAHGTRDEKKWKQASWNLCCLEGKQAHNFHQGIIKDPSLEWLVVVYRRSALKSLSPQIVEIQFYSSPARLEKETADPS